MKAVSVIQADPYLNFPRPVPPQFVAEDYAHRLLLLREHMQKEDITHCVVYADREHFANMDYFIGFEPRYEEALLLVPLDGQMTLLVGNECLAYSYVSPVPLRRLLYQNFSLQGQPRDSLRPLWALLEENGLHADAKIGVIGFKWFEPAHMDEADSRVDIPAYLVEELCKLVPRDRIVNFTKALTRMDGGIRMTLHSVKEIAWYEHACSITSNRIIELTRNLRPGISEMELSVGFDGSPTNAFPLINFGEENIQTVLSSPDETRLKEGDPVLLDYGIRGSLTCRAGIAAADEAVFRARYGDALETFFKPYFLALAAWYESLAVGARCADSFQAVKAVFGTLEAFGVSLNPGHCIATDEWTNSPFFEASPYHMGSGFYLQSDVIASQQNPACLAIMEDGLVLADRSMREDLQKAYPDVAMRIQRRRDQVRDLIGIDLGDDVLPLSNSQAIYHPYLLDMSRIFVLR